MSSHCAPATGKEHETRAADSVCRHFGVLDARHRPPSPEKGGLRQGAEATGASKAHCADGRGGTVKSPRRLDQAVPAAIDVPAQAGDVRALTLVIVDRLDLMRVWNELMLREHPQGAGPLVPPVSD